MAGQTVIVSVLADTTKFKNALGGADNALGKFAGSVNRTTRRIGIAVAAAGAAFIALGAASIKAAEESQAASKKLDAVANSIGVFGQQTQVVTGRLKDYASKLQFSTGVQDEVINGAQTILLTFKPLAKTADQVGGAFDRATMASLDLSAAGFGDVNSAAKMLGKALADPVKGITALTRAGVNFTQQQKDQIKALVANGDMLGAQNIILTEVESQVGGAAEAGATSSQKFNVAIGELQETLGNVLLPAFTEVTTAVAKYLDKLQDNPKFKKFMQDLGKAAKDFGQWLINDVLPALVQFGQWVMENGPFIKFLATTILAVVGALRLYAIIMAAVNIVQAINNALLYANPITWIVLAIVALIAVIAILIMNWENINKVLQDVWKNIVDWFMNLPKMIMGFVKDAIKWLQDTGKNIINGLLKGLTDAGKGVMDFFTNLGGWIVDAWNNFWGIKSPSKKMMKLGKYITQGLAIGLSDTASIEKAVRGINTSVTGGISVGGVGTGNSNTYNITVQAVAPNAEVGRAVVDAIAQYERFNGGRGFSYAN